MNEAHAILRAEAAVEHRQMFRLQLRSTFNSSGSVDMRHNPLGLFGRIAELDERLWNRVVDDLDDAAAYQFLVFHQREVRLHTCRVAIHHETDSACGGQHRGLSIAITGALPKLVRMTPALLRRLKH